MKLFNFLLGSALSIHPFTSEAPTTANPDKCQNIHIVYGSHNKNNKLKFISETSALVQYDVKYSSEASHDVRTDAYIGFLQFFVGKCGNDFLQAMVDHRVTFSFLDKTEYYTTDHFARYKENGNWSKSVIQFNARGLPPAPVHHRNQIQNGGGDRPHLGTKRSDRYMLQINGLDQVDWTGVNKLECLYGAKSASAPEDFSGDDFTHCALNNN